MTPIDLDVRTLQEWNEGHKPGAMHFDLERLLAGEMPDIPKETSLNVYCHSGNRAQIAVEILHEHFFVNAKNAGGFS